MSRLGRRAPPRLNNLANFLGASLSSSSRPFQGSLSSTEPRSHFLSFSLNRALADNQMQFPVECGTVPCPWSGSDPFPVLHRRSFWIRLGRSKVTEPPTANNSGQSEHLAALCDLNFQLFEGPKLRHQPQTGSGEPVGCQLNPTLGLKTQPQPLAFQPLTCLRI